MTVPIISRNTCRSVSLYLAEVYEYGWDDEGDAFVKMVLNVKEVGDIIGLDVIDQEEIIEVEGRARR